MNADGSNQSRLTNNPADDGDFFVDWQPLAAVRTQGDVDCNGGVTSVDALKELRYVAALSVAQSEPCPDIGDDVASVWGDVDCNVSVTSVDGLKILRYVAALSVAQTEPCPDIGTPEG
jgi:hypothetical protein